MVGSETDRGIILRRKKKKPDYRVRYLGLVDYDTAHAYQLKLHAERVAGNIPDTLLLMEHRPVITMGRRGGTGNLLVPPEELAARGIQLKEVERGGDITYHGPGQLVGYPIFQIKDHLAGIRPFVRKLEQALIEALAKLNIHGETKEGFTGVWVGEEKIAAIGLAVKRWVTFHGFALNVCNDLSPFDLINPCGIGKNVTSVERALGTSVSFTTVHGLVEWGFERVFVDGPDSSSVEIIVEGEVPSFMCPMVGGSSA